MAKYADIENFLKENNTTKRDVDDLIRAVCDEKASDLSNSSIEDRVEFLIKEDIFSSSDEFFTWLKAR